jgi:NAD(P)-dependent dehydrogenase (short-subunit alcohol dehydrogenase family)
MKRVWFVTGFSRGLGREVVQAALDIGDVVAATARRPEQLADLVDVHGERIMPLALDVTDAAAAEKALVAAKERFGSVDVVVNNPGYAMLHRSRPAMTRTSGPSSRRTSGVSTTCRRRCCRYCGPKAVG